MENVQIKTTVELLDELPEDMKDGEVLIDNTDFSDNIVEEDFHVLENELEEAISNIKTIDDYINESDMDEKDKELLKNVFVDGGLDINTLQEEAVKRHLEEVFNDKEKGLYKLIPYLYTTDPDEAKIETPFLNIVHDGVTYYLKDIYKELKHSAQGDKEYNLYFIDILKINLALEEVEFKDDNGEDIKSKIFVEFFALMKSLEDIIVHRYNEIVESEAYVTAIDSVFNLESETFINSLKEEFTNIVKLDFDKGKLPRFKKLFYDTMIKKNKKVPRELVRQFSELLDDLGGLFLIALERIVLNEDKDFFQHVNDVNNKMHINDKLTKEKVTYLISKMLRNAYLNKNLRWTLVSIEKQLYGKDFRDSYLLAKLFLLAEALKPTWDELNSEDI